MVKKRNSIVFEIEDYYGNTVMAFTVDEKGNVVKTENCNLRNSRRYENERIGHAFF